jgi:hypothetical protein
VSQGVRARRRLLARPALPRRTLLWHDYQCASRKPAPPFPPSLRHHVSPRAEQIVNQTPSRCQRLPRDSGTIINAHRVGPSLPSRRAPSFPPSLRLKETQARGLPFLFTHEAGNIYSACVSPECTISPRRENKAKHTNETPTLRRSNSN